MAEYNQVDLQIGTEAQLADKVKDLPVGTLVGLTDPIHKSELDTTLQNEITSAGGEVVDLGTAKMGNLTAEQLAILQASDNNLIKQGHDYYRKVWGAAGETDYLEYSQITYSGSIPRVSDIRIAQFLSRGWSLSVAGVMLTPANPPSSQSFIVVSPAGTPSYLGTANIAKINEINNFTEQQNIAYDITSDHCIALTVDSGVRVGNQAGSPSRTEYDNGEIRRRTSATDLYTYTLPEKTGTLALTSDIEKMYQHNIEFNTERGQFHYSFYSSKSDAYTSADLPDTELIPLCYEPGATPDVQVNYATIYGTIERASDTESLSLYGSGVYYDATNAEFKHFSETNLEIDASSIIDTVK